MWFSGEQVNKMVFRSGNQWRYCNILLIPKLLYLHLYSAVISLEATKLQAAAFVV